MPRLLEALDRAGPFLDQMMLSIHQVSFMRHLKSAALEIIREGMSELVMISALNGILMAHQVVKQRGRPAIVCYVHYSVLHSQPIGDPSSSNDRVREAIPWLRTLSNARSQDFQRAAVFEWLLDQALHAGASEDGVQTLAADLAQFARSSDPRDLPSTPQWLDSLRLYSVGTRRL
jgi:hypothetical protein